MNSEQKISRINTIKKYMPVLSSLNKMTELKNFGKNPENLMESKKVKKILRKSETFEVRQKNYKKRIKEGAINDLTLINNKKNRIKYFIDSIILFLKLILNFLGVLFVPIKTILRLHSGRLIVEIESTLSGCYLLEYIHYLYSSQDKSHYFFSFTSLLDICNIIPGKFSYKTQ